MPAHPHPTARRPRRMALAVAVLFGLSSLFALAAPAATFAWDNESFDSASEADLVALTNRSRASAGLKALKVDSTLHVRRPLAQQGHDRPRLLQPRHPGLRQGLGQAPRRSATATTSPARTSAGTTTRTTSPRPPSTRCSWTRPATAPTSWARPGTSSASAPTRARPARRCGRSCSPTSAARPTPAPKPTAKPKPKPTRQADRQADRQARPPGPAAPTTAPAVADRPPCPRPDAAPEPDPDATAPADDGSPQPSFDDRRAEREPSTGTPSAAPVGRHRRRRGRRCAWSTGPTSDGLLETIVGGVTGFFFGG